MRGLLISLCVIAFSGTPSKKETDFTRAKYFSIKTYESQLMPSIYDIKDQLPKPIISDYPGREYFYIELSIFKFKLDKEGCEHLTI
ncbi:MAG: hypothetical protein JXR03_20020 [Cyclobacteriaceae bacterium]